MFDVDFVMDSFRYHYPMPVVPREGDTVRLDGQERKVVNVVWDPAMGCAGRSLATVFLGERR